VEAKTIYIFLLVVIKTIYIRHEYHKILYCLSLNYTKLLILVLIDGSPSPSASQTIKSGDIEGMREHFY
jgi:hypothetical protein